MGPNDCPDPDQLRQLLLGKIALGEAERLAEHLERCPDCADRIEHMPARDPLLDALRAGYRAGMEPEADPAVVAEIVARLENLVLSTPGQGTLSSGVTGNSTVPLLPPLGVEQLKHFHLRGLLGQGGMGLVFEAEDQDLRRTVALKVMRPEVAARPGARVRFLREARAAAALDHPNIIPIYHVDEQDGVPFLVMPLLAGETLAARLTRDPLPSLCLVLRVGQAVAEGLAVAHSRTLFHRDIKPANIWLEGTPPGPGGCDCGRVLLFDFGLAGAGRDLEALTPSQPGALLGTPGYMAPEQARGEEADGRSDLFGLGCVLYEMSVGRRPFQGPNTLAILHAVQNHDPQPLHELRPSLPRPFSDLVMRLLARDPAQRPASAGEVAAALTALRVSPGRPRPPALPVGSPPRRRRRFSPWAVLGVGLFALAALAFALAVAVVLAPCQPPERTAREEGLPEDPLPAALPLPALAPGYLVVEVEDDVVHGALLQRRVRLREQATQHAIELKPGRHLLAGGTYAVVEEGEAEARLVFSPRTVRINGDQTTLRIGLECGEAWRFSGELHGGGVSRVCFHPRGNRVFLRGGKVAGFDLRSGRECALLAHGPEDGWGMDVSRDGASLVLDDPQSGTSQLWDWESDQPEQTLAGRRPAGKASHLCFSPDGERILSLCQDQSLRVWDTQTGRETGHQEGALFRPHEVAAVWMPDSRHVLTNHADGFLRLWDADMVQEERKLKGPGDPPCTFGSLAVSPDGAMALIGTESRVVRLWDLRSETEIRTFLGHERKAVSEVAFSPDGKRALSGGADGSLRLWDVQTGRELHHFEHEGAVTGLCFSPDGRYALSCSFEDRTVRLWRLPRVEEVGKKG